MDSTCYKIRLFLNIAESLGRSEFFNKLLEYLYENMDCSSIIIDDHGNILYSKVSMIPQSSCWNIIENEKKIREIATKKINLIKNILYNFNYNELSLLDEYDCAKVEKCYGVLIPIETENHRDFSILLFKYTSEFLQDDEIIYEIISSFILIMEKNNKKTELSHMLKKNSDIISVISILSYSEVKAVQHVIYELDGKDGILVGSKVANEARITRSVVVNALRKLEGASIIQTRSLGVKGTNIKFLVPIDKLQEAIKNK